MSACLILGAGGVGTAITRLLLQSDRFRRVTVADAREERVEALRAEFPGSRLAGAVVDAGDSRQVRAVLQGHDLLINATHARYNLGLMEAAVAAGAHYIDLASEGPPEQPGQVDISDQLAYDGRFRERRLLAVLGMGMDPGLSNLYARWAADRLDTVDAITIYDGDNSRVEGYPLAFYFSPDTLIEECLQPPVVYADGEYRVGTPLETGAETWPFPQPVGPLPVYSVAHEEVATLPRFLGKPVGRCEFKYALSDTSVQILRTLALLGLHRREPPVQVDGRPVSPRQVVAALLPEPVDLGGRVRGHCCLSVVVQGRAGGHERGYHLYTVLSHEEAYARLGATATAYGTALPAAVLAEMLVEGRIRRRGVAVPEQLAPDELLRRLAQRGLPTWVEERRLYTDPFGVEPARRRCSQASQLPALPR